MDCSIRYLSGMRADENDALGLRVEDLVVHERTLCRKVARNHFFLVLQRSSSSSSGQMQSAVLKLLLILFVAEGVGKYDSSPAMPCAARRIQWRRALKALLRKRFVSSSFRFLRTGIGLLQLLQRE